MFELLMNNGRTWPGALLHFDGASGSTGMIDVHGHAFTAAGSAQLTSAQAWAGGTSLYVGTQTGNLVKANDHPDFRLTGDCTIESRVWLNNVTGDLVLVEKSADQTTQSTRCWVELYGRQVYLKLSGNTGQAIALTTGVLTAQSWFHLAITKRGSVWDAWLDGAHAGSLSSGLTFGDNAGPLVIGNLASGTAPFQGYIDELRITNGLARYTAPFAPPTGPFAF